MITTSTGVSSFLTVEQVAARYNCSVDSIWRWKRNGEFPAAVRIGRGATRWRLEDLIKYESKFQACMMVDGTFLLEIPAFMDQDDTEESL
ncbi:MAG: helix-turn-helix protein [Cypionkella sp.]|uniref:helix-turn-helix transcriptional regulator n=1 Tax=Cypionkella sp. TaxID=2811411 RepID=UPI00261373F2|nr:helix-turn-helix domain-containing protein [Cypionkella sp.]MDB5660359.1 helix-turn-helix protein [Cypionkella sp.]